MLLAIVIVLVLLLVLKQTRHGSYSKHFTPFTFLLKLPFLAHPSQKWSIHFSEESAETVSLDSPRDDRPSGSDLLLTKAQVEANYEHGTWQRETYEEFRKSVLAKENGATFPCVYATKGYRDNDHRYVFLASEDPSERRNIHIVGHALKSYLRLAHSLGPNTSLVLIAQPAATEQSIDVYNARFWNLLRGLRIYDQTEWPDDVPSSTSDPRWTFCFAGEPVFPIALTPAHERRWSRHASTLVIAIQPKWVIDNLMSTPERRQNATEKVRGLLRKYDRVAVSPLLANYGAPGSSESQQLVLGDNEEKIRVLFGDMDASGAVTQHVGS